MSGIFGVTLYMNSKITTILLIFRSLVNLLRSHINEGRHLDLVYRFDFALKTA